ncbi:polysaccharide deacetylase family protein [Paenibacillus sp. FSL W8-0194]|uniref:polysaccharide deacetylase family protein n=1 Tax=Paenibacillus sp. FSL W8-0194 TaxID=2921711 RepID=UPI0030DC76E1
MKRKRLVTAGAVAVLIGAASSLPMGGQAAVEGGFVQPAPRMTAVTPAGVNGQALNAAAKTGIGTGPIQEEPGGGGIPAPLRDTSFQQEHPAKVYYRDKVIALMYHEVTPGQKNKQSLNAAKFERQLILMKENGFQWITMKQYADFVLHGKSVPPNAVLMTFDDGYESFYEYVYPLLLKYRVPATSFLIVGTIDHPQHAGIPKLSWKQVQEMHASGVDFYSHSFDSHQYAPLDAAGKRSKAILRGPGLQQTAWPQGDARGICRPGAAGSGKSQCRAARENRQRNACHRLPLRRVFALIASDMQGPGYAGILHGAFGHQ